MSDFCINNNNDLDNDIFCINNFDFNKSNIIKPPESPIICNFWKHSNYCC